MISIIIPAHDEEKAIGAVLDELIEVLEGQAYEIIVVDDGSTDNTAEIVQEKQVKLIQHPQNIGYGATIKTGIKNATTDLILITDADGSYPSDDIPRLLEYTDKYDMVVGARTGETVRIQLYKKDKVILTRMDGYIAKYCKGIYNEASFYRQEMICEKKEEDIQ